MASTTRGPKGLSIVAREEAPAREGMLAGLDGLSTMMTIQTPTRSSEPRSGVHDIQRVWPRSVTDSSPLVVVSWVAPFGAWWGSTDALLGWLLSRSLERCDLGELEIQEMRAVTAIPEEKASARPSRTEPGAPMWDRKGDWRRPGMRRAGETNMMRRDG